MMKLIKALDKWGDKIEARLFAGQMLGVPLYWWVMALLITIAVLVFILMENGAIHEYQTAPK